MAQPKKKPRSISGPGHKSGNVLLSHKVPLAVPSALEGLTTEFGMGSGVAPPQSSPEKSGCCASPSAFRVAHAERNVEKTSHYP